MWCGPLRKYVLETHATSAEWIGRPLDRTIKEGEGGGAPLKGVRPFICDVQTATAAASDNQRRSHYWANSDNAWT